jgi:hypothetical protein
MLVGCVRKYDDVERRDRQVTEVAMEMKGSARNLIEFTDTRLVPLPYHCVSLLGGDRIYLVAP